VRHFLFNKRVKMGKKTHRTYIKKRKKRTCECFWGKRKRIKNWEEILL